LPRRSAEGAKASGRLARCNLPILTRGWSGARSAVDLLRDLVLLEFLV
jgi:hypothetical protein